MHPDDELGKMVADVFSDVIVWKLVCPHMLRSGTEAYEWDRGLGVGMMFMSGLMLRTGTEAQKCDSMSRSGTEA